jgi:HTH-type transcriptional regulator / antitoxin HipB
MSGSQVGITEQIKAARKKKGLSQKSLGIKVGIPQSHISKIEQGKVDLQTSSLIQLARVLDLELMLVPRQHITAVQALELPAEGRDSIPAYRLDKEEDDFT